MIKIKDNIVNWFTLIELVVVIAIVSILWTWTLNLFNSHKEDLNIDNEIWDIRQYGMLISNIISKHWDIPTNYCRNSSWLHDSNCFKVDSNSDWITDNLCSWIEWDLELDNDCDNWCVIIDCSVTTCTWNNEYYDLEYLFNENITYNYTIKTDSFMNKMWYRICPLNDSLSSQIIWKWVETEFWTFNPSFTLYYNGRPVYEYNSNP